MAITLLNNGDTGSAAREIINTAVVAINKMTAGTRYISVYANGTDIQNAAELLAAYDEAKTMFPADTNRITIIAAPGYYNFGTTPFTMEAEYIDLVSLDGNRSIIFNASLNISNRTEGSISVTANDVFVKGVDVQTKNFTIISNLNLLKVENCIGGDFSFGGDPLFQGLGEIVSGTFINCQGGDFSFGAVFGHLSGTFTNCVAANNGMGGFGGQLSGIFTNCQGGTGSFGSISSGTCNSCIAGDNSFGGDGGTASGTFNSCIAGDNSFGGIGLMSGVLSGKLYYCILTAGTFITVAVGGVTRYCLNGDNSTDNQG